MIERWQVSGEAPAPDEARPYSAACAGWSLAVRPNGPAVIESRLSAMGRPTTSSWSTLYSLLLQRLDIPIQNRS